MHNAVNHPIGILLGLVMLAPVASAQRRGGQAFAIEASGGMVGSAAGFSLGVLAVRGCGDENLACKLEGAATGGLTSVLKDW